MQIVDSHCHIDFDPLYADLPGVLARARANDVAYLLCISVNLEDYPRVREIAAQHAHIRCSVGVHPNTSEGREPSIEELIALGQDPLVAAIGETGLDYFRSEGDLEWQRERFRRHIRAARQLQKPIIVHTREAAADTLRLLREEQASDCGGVIHCFSEDWDFAEQALDLGLYLSFSGIVTFKSAKAVQDAARRAPPERILVETDAPYLAPAPHRGKTNEPAYVRHTLEFLADLRGESVEMLAQVTTDNYFRLFGGDR